MRKGFGVVVMLATLVAFAGCEKGDNTYDKAVNQGKLAMANGEYDKAMASFELALDEKSDEEVQELYNELILLKKIQKAYQEENWNEALNIGNSLLEAKELSVLIKEEVRGYINKAQEQQEVQKVLAGYNAKIEEVKQLTKSKEYETALKKLEEIQQDKRIVNSTEIITTINDLLKQIMQEEANEKANQQQEKNKDQEVKYKLYHNERYGFSIEYPDIFDEQQLPTNGDGCIFRNQEKDVCLTVTGYNNLNNLKAETEYYVALAAHTDINYEFQRDNWYVISWEEGETMYYEKVVIGEGSVNLFTISYPSVDEKLYDNTIEWLFSSFKTPGISECW